MQRDTSTQVRVLVLVRSGCHLCADAVAVVATVCAEVGCGWTSQDVDTDEQLKASYSDHVPVTFVDGQRLSYWFVDEGQLRSALAG